MSMRIGIRAWIDFAFKKIFGKPGNEVCLISLLNSVLDLPKPIESVEFLNPFSLKEFEEAKLVCVDVKATDTDSVSSSWKSRSWSQRALPSGLCSTPPKRIWTSSLQGKVTAS
jgi:hypothetical protein